MFTRLYAYSIHIHNIYNRKDKSLVSNRVEFSITKLINYKIKLHVVNYTKIDTKKYNVRDVDKFTKVFTSKYFILSKKVCLKSF